MTAPPRLSDGEVVVDAFTSADVDAHLANEDEEMARRFGWWPARSTRGHVEAAIRDWAEAWAQAGTERGFAVRDAATGALAGFCELRIQPDQIGHLSYSTGPAWRRRGIASRALRLVAAWAFAELGLERLELYIELDNTASRGVARRAGFREEGILRGRGRFASGERHDQVLCARLPGDD